MNLEEKLSQRRYELRNDGSPRVPSDWRMRWAELVDAVKTLHGKGFTVSSDQYRLEIIPDKEGAAQRFGAVIELANDVSDDEDQDPDFCMLLSLPHSGRPFTYVFNGPERLTAFLADRIARAFPEEP